MKHTKKNQPHATKQLAKPVERECRQMKEKTAAEAARSSLATLQENFEKHFGLDSQEQWAKEDNNRLQLTPTANERREHKRNIEREVNREKEDLLEEADFKAFFTGSRSRREYERCRKDGSLGPKADAEKRMRERLDGKRKKNHVSLNYEGMQRNWQALVNEAESWEEGKKINWSALARKYEVHKPSDPTSLAGNGGQIIQAVLEDAGFDTSRFVGGKGQQTGAPRCRRSK